MARNRELSNGGGPVVVACLLAVCLLAGPWIGAGAQRAATDDDFSKAVQVIVYTLDYLKEKDQKGNPLSKRFLDDVAKGRVRVGDLDTSDGELATTGTSNLLGIGQNTMTLDDTVLILAQQERLWKAKRFAADSIDYLAWAETVVHEYVHMGQKDPKNVPKFEDPAYLSLAKTHVRWYDRLNAIYAALSEKNPSRRAEKLRSLRGILGQLLSLQGTFAEAVQRKVADNTLNAHLSFANKGLDARIRKTLARMDAELKAIDARLAAGKAGSAGPTTTAVRPTTTVARSTTVTSGWYQDGSPRVEKTAFTPDACYPSASLDIADGAATGTRTWTDACGGGKCSGTYVGTVTWTKLPAFLEPGRAVTVDATAGTTAQNTCGYRNFGSSVWLTLNGSTFVQAGESQYSGPPKATGTFTVPSGQPGARLTIEVHVQAASLSGKMTLSYIYR